VAPLEACTRYGAKAHLLPRLFWPLPFFFFDLFSSSHTRNIIPTSPWETWLSNMEGGLGFHTRLFYFALFCFCGSNFSLGLYFGPPCCIYTPRHQVCCEFSNSGG
jgi:hypothetical protein